jgi:hypothetical protein
MPWLYYYSSADKVINDTQRIQFQVSFDPNDQVNVNRFQYYLSKYDIVGNYMGTELLTTQLQFCSKSLEDGFNYKSFGTTIVNACNINLSELSNRNNTMYFYEIFLYDTHNEKYIDIPVMIDNIPNPKSTAPGNLNNATDPTDWILTRRFFLVDNLSALQNLGDFKNDQAVAFAIRYPKLLKLITVLQNVEGSHIMVPYLEIFYKTQVTSTQDPQLKYSYLKFVSEYRMDISNFQNTMRSIFIVLNIFVFVAVIVKMYIWYKLNPPTLSPVMISI